MMQINKLKITTLFISLITNNFCIVNALNIQLQEKLHEAIKENDPSKIEKYLKNTEVDINAALDDITPIHEALINLNKYKKETFKPMSLIWNFILLGGASFTGKQTLNQAKYSLDSDESLKEGLNKVIEEETEKWHKNPNMSRIKLDQYLMQRNLLTSNPNEYRRQIKVGLILFSAGFIAFLAALAQKGVAFAKLYDNIKKAKKIIEIISSNTKFVADEDSIDYASYNLPDYLNLISKSNLDK